MAPYSGAKFSKKVGGASKKSRNNEVKSKSKDTVKNVAKKSMKNTTKKEFDHSALPRDDGGRLLKTVGAVGLAAGGVAYDGETGLAVRVERSVPPLITLEMVEAARGFLAKGEIHLACAALRHDDASTIKVILTAWENKKANDTDTSTLSETARLRVSNDAFSTLHSAFTIERIGESSLPLEFIGRRFLDGDELLSTADVHLTYSLLVADEGRWLRAPDLKRLLTARMDTLRPVGQIKLNNDLTVSFSTELVGEEDCDSHRYRVVEHAAADASLVSAASIVLALPKSLAAEPAILDGGIAPESMSVEEEYQEPTQVGSCFRPLFGDVVRGCSKTLFRVPCLRSKLSKALCRGRPLCGDAEDIIAPLRDLLELDICDPRSGESGTAATLGCFLVSGLASSSPWIHGALSLPVVMALWLCAAADRQLRFAAFVTERLEATALGLWARDDPEALWPWRGWRDKEPKPIVFSEWECMNEDPLSQCRDALRAALLLGCVTATSAKFAKTLFARVLGKLLEGSVDLLQLPSDVRSISNTIQALKIEARLAAYDNTLRPSFLILMQACLSYPPRVPELHYLKSLAEAVHRLSSGINARAARQCLDGAIDTSRFTSFLDSSKRDFASNFKSTAGSSSSEMSKTPKLMFPTWSSASEAVRLTAAEKDLYRIVLSVQSELAHALQDTDCGKPTHQRSHFGQLADRAIKEALEYSSTTEVEDEVKGRKPTAYEAKAAFLTLFGERQAVKLLPENHNYWAMFMGDGRLAIQRDSDEPRKYLDPNSDTHTRVAEVLLSEILAPPGIAFPSDRKPPVGFSWNFLDPNNDEENLHISVVRQHNGRYSFYIGDLEVPAGDATPALSTYGWSGGDSANYQIPSDLETLIRRGLYLDEPSVECDLSLIASLDAVARGRLQLDKRCFEWLNLAKSSPINRNAWRDALVKLNCRTDSGLVSMATCSRDGSRGGNAAVSQFEGLVLRIYYILAALYPAIITRVTELQFIIDDSLGLHFIHLLRNLNILAFSYFDDGSAFSTPLVNEKTTPIKTRRLVSVGLLPSRRSPHFDTPEPPALAMMMDSDSDASDDAIDEQKAKIIETPKKLSLPTRPSLNLGALPDGGHATLYAANWIDETEQDNQAHEKCPEITTTLWSHQREARDNIIFGIKTGKRGFADASTVGAGKSLTALSVCCAVNKLLLERAVRRCGCLILCPTISLITEWCQQAMLHTSGFEVIVQRANGALMSKGWTTGSGRAARTQAKTVALGSSSLVITTLSRNREHPFTNQPLFDLCVIDECLSVQSESAMQAAEAWRSVSSSRCGCLMLSATLFRSSYKSLFYLIRMLRSPIPRTPSFLPALLQEHVSCYVPQNRRTWKLHFEHTPLNEISHAAYRSRVEAFAAKRVGRGVGTPRDLYVQLKAFLREHFEPTTLIDAIKNRVYRLRKQGRKVIVFANTERELERIIAKIDAIRLDVVRKIQKREESGDAIDEMENDDDDEILKNRVLVLTINEGSHGINLQRFGDAIVCRPQPGDILEQCKGRIDRPGQAKNKLEAHIVLAAGTIEEAEAANIRLVGQFFRQYLDPISKTFQDFAINAQLANTAAATALSRTTTVAQVYTKSIAAIAQGCDAAPLSSTNNDMTNEAIDDDDESDAAHLSTPKNVKRKASNEIIETAMTKVATPVKKPKKEFQIASSTNTPALRLCADVLPEALKHLTSVDKRLAAVITQIGPPTSMLDSIPAQNLNANPWPPVSWKSLTKSIVYQQLSTQVAQKIFSRLVDACGGMDTFNPDSLLALEESKLLSPKHGGIVGLSRSKASYVRGIAELFQTGGKLTDAILAALDDEAVIKTLCQVKGLGEWSCHMFLMFGLGRPDILPVGDLAIQKGFKKLYGTNSQQTGATSVNELPTRKQMEAISDAWRPWRTIGSWYMWHVVETAAANWV